MARHRLEQPPVFRSGARHVSHAWLQPRNLRCVVRGRSLAALVCVTLAAVYWQSVGAAAAGRVGASVSDLPIPVDDWAYQLQGYSKGQKEIAASLFDLVVIDYSRFGDEGSAFTRAEIDALRFDGACGRRVVLAYLSIGEAETYRYYFNPSWIDEEGNPVAGVAPAFLGPFNPDYPDNYKVRYWLRPWKKVIYGVPAGPGKSYLDRIIDAGFDGVYLDIVDAFEFWGPREIDGNDENRRAASHMARFVRQIARYARRNRRHGEFLIIPQNGSNIIDSSSYPDASDPDREADKQKKRYFKAIDGIGAEDTFFFGDRENNNPYDPQWEIVGFLDQFVAAGNTVLAIDYLTDPSKTARFYAEAGARGYVPHVSRRALNRLTIPRGLEPDCD